MNTYTITILRGDTVMAISLDMHVFIGGRPCPKSQIFWQRKLDNYLVHLTKQHECLICTTCWLNLLALTLLVCLQIKDSREESGRFSGVFSSSGSPRLGFSRSSSRLSMQDDTDDADFPFAVDDVDPDPRPGYVSAPSSYFLDRTVLHVPTKFFIYFVVKCVT